MLEERGESPSLRDFFSPRGFGALRGGRKGGFRSFLSPEISIQNSIENSPRLDSPSAFPEDHPSLMLEER